ncbi:MAG: hypothetical protein V1904_11870 [Bacteroidota bacterium]
MKGDILIIDENHRKAAKQIIDIIFNKISENKNKYVISVAGESGAGKSEIAVSVKELLEKKNIKSYIFGQDDYFVYPPKTNARQREEDVSRVGMQEVQLDLLDRNLKDAQEGGFIIKKPLVDFNADTIGEELADLTEYKVLIVEGTYTLTLKNVDCKVFINRIIYDTIESRKKRAREKQDDFLDKILIIEHEIISKHKAFANIIITKSFDAEINSSIKF